MKKNRLKQSIRNSVVLIFLSSVLPLVAAGQPIIANFSDGESTTLPDGFTGSAGNGWAGAWSSPNIPQRGSLDFSIESSSPLTPGGGNYLSVQSARTETGTIRAALRREFDKDVVNPLNVHTVTMSVRFDDFDSGSWYVYGDNSTTTSTGATNTWMVVANESVGWRAVTGHSDTGSPLHTNMGLDVVSGVTYHITVNINPGTQTYDLFVEGSNEQSGSLLNNVYRTQETTPTTLDANWLNFYASPTAVGDSLNYSLDSISIIPEPGYTVAAIGALLLVLGYRRKSSRARMRS